MVNVKGCYTHEFKYLFDMKEVRMLLIIYEVGTSEFV